MQWVINWERERERADHALTSSSTPTIRNMTQRTKRVPLGEASLPQYHSLSFSQPLHHAASRGTTEPKRAYDPAVVFSLSFVAIVSFSSTGIPCNYPNNIERSPFIPLSRSTSSAWSCASGLTSTTLRSRGFNISIRSK